MEPDGLLSVEALPDGSLSYAADHLARQHVAATDIDVRDFHVLTQRYWNKIVARHYPEVANRVTQLTPAQGKE